MVWSLVGIRVSRGRGGAGERTLPPGRRVGWGARGGGHICRLMSVRARVRWVCCVAEEETSVESWASGKRAALGAPPGQLELPQPQAGRPRSRGCAPRG